MTHLWKECDPPTHTHTHSQTLQHRPARNELKLTGFKGGFRGGAGCQEPRRQGRRANEPAVKQKLCLKSGWGGGRCRFVKMQSQSWENLYYVSVFVIQGCDSQECYRGRLLRWHTCGLLAGKTEKIHKWPLMFPCLLKLPFIKSSYLTTVR